MSCGEILGNYGEILGNFEKFWGILLSCGEKVSPKVIVVINFDKL